MIICFKFYKYIKEFKIIINAKLNFIIINY